MATTTATVTINSTDLLTDELSLSTSCTLTNADGNNGLTGTSGLGRKTLASGHAEYVLFDGTDYVADKAHKIYLKNTSTDPTEFFKITINSEEIGRLYSLDWMFMPWSAHDADNDIKIDPSADNMTLEYMLFID
jgi:hypothetical protein|tara:strand:+ start:114 stop:515 length:402 start_codon:yes stop_codon:yes gene_type:complete